MIRRALAGFRARWGLMLGAGLLLGGPPHVLGLMVMIGAPLSSKLDVLLIPLAWLVQGILVGLLYGLSALALVQQSRGVRTSAGALWGGLLRCGFPTAAAAGLAWLATRIGMLLLVIPGLILGPFLCLAAPVAAVEGKGAFTALRRSWALSRGARWTLAGVMLLMLAVHLAGAALLALPIVRLTDQTESGAITGISLLSPVLTGIITAPIAALLLAAAYVELTSGEDGPASHLAAVFD